MTTPDFTWTDDGDLMGDRIPAECVPGRVALTAPQCISRDTDGAVLLIDPHPEGTWNSWMYPYASLVRAIPELVDFPQFREGSPSYLTLDSNSKFGDLTAALVRLRGDLQSEFEEAIRLEVNNVLPTISKGWQRRPFFENYSLKFSKTSNSYTAYDFLYFMNLVKDLAPEVPHVWVQPNDLLTALQDANQFEGKSVSSNVVDSLSAVIRAQETL